MFKEIVMRFLQLALLALILLANTGLAAGAKYIFLFIGDGMALQQRMLAEEYQRKMTGAGLAINAMPYQAPTKTHSASAHVTDSAAAGTAIACGEKTRNQVMGMDATGARKLTSIAKTAQAHGRKVGIVTSVTINHATPAAFYANQPSRNNYYEIGLDLVASGFDYFGGGGVSQPDNTKSAAYQGNIYELAVKNGYAVISGKKDFAALKPGIGKVLARGSDGALPYAINQTGNLSLADFTRKGIELLDNPNGFFMMIEGGAIDYCGHNNDAGALLHEMLAFDDAVQVALDFAEKLHDHVLIVVTGDHETGGLTIGNKGIEFHDGLELLQYQKHSTDNNVSSPVGTFTDRVQEAIRARPDFTMTDLLPILADCYGLRADLPDDHPMKLTAEDLKAVSEALARHLDPKSKARRTLPLAVLDVMNRRTGVTWSTTGHTAMPVITSAIGPGADKFMGILDNTDIAKIIRAILEE